MNLTKITWKFDRLYFLWWKSFFGTNNIEDSDLGKKIYIYYIEDSESNN
jgi:hypothetical protein